MLNPWNLLWAYFAMYAIVAMTFIPQVTMKKMQNVAFAAEVLLLLTTFMLAKEILPYWEKAQYSPDKYFLPTQMTITTVVAFIGISVHLWRLCTKRKLQQALP